MKKRLTKKGFTLPEVMMAVVISMLIFAAMGVLLTRCFSLWLDSMARWKVAQTSRVTRTRILYGGFGPGSGLLSSTNVSVSTYGSSWDLISFSPAATNGVRQIYGWVGSVPNDIWLKNVADSTWSWAQSVSKYLLTDPPVVKTKDFDVSVSNRVMTISYTLSFGAMGRTFEQPQTIRAYLNE